MRGRCSHLNAIAKHGGLGLAQPSPSRSPAPQYDRSMSKTANAPPWLLLSGVLFTVAFGANHFAPMMLVYSQELGSTPQLMSSAFGIYGLGLVPGIALGARVHGERSVLRTVSGALALSLASSLVLMAAPSSGEASLLAGRAAAGLASGLAFAAGGAWLLRLSSASGRGAGAVRNTVALTSGFASGPLVAGAIGELGRTAMVLAYLPHAFLAAVAAAALWQLRGPGTPAQRPVEAPGLLEPVRFPWRAAAAAPLSFGAAVTAFAVLPQHGANVTPFSAGLLTALTLGCGVAVQPYARRRAARGAAPLRRIGFLLASWSFAAGSGYAALPSVAFLVAAAVLGGLAYGLLFVQGFMALGDRPSPGRVSVMYGFAYAGFAFPPVIEVMATTLELRVVLLALALSCGAAFIVAWAGRAPVRDPEGSRPSASA